MTKAEELVNGFMATKFGRISHADLVTLLESYGRFVQEAAAKAIEETCFYDEYAGLTANDLAESIRDRPLP